MSAAGCGLPSRCELVGVGKSDEAEQKNEFKMIWNAEVVTQTDGGWWMVVGGWREMGYTVIVSVHIYVLSVVSLLALRGPWSPRDGIRRRHRTSLVSNGGRRQVK